MVAPEARVREPAPARARRLLGALRLLRGDRLHARAPAARQAISVDGALVHGAPPGHGVPVARVRCCSTGRCSAASTPTRAFRATELLLAGARAAGAARSIRTPPRSPRPRRAAERGRARRCASSPHPTRPRPRCTCSRTAATTSRHQRRRRLQPLARSGGDALARGPHPRLLGQLLLPARRRRRGAFWSVTHQPTLVPASQLRGDLLARAAPSSAAATTTSRRHVEISVSPEDDIELRRVTHHQPRPRRARTIELTSYAEVVLAPPAADAAHPAFSNLFVQTELLRDQRGDPVHAPAALERGAPAVDAPPDDRARRRASGEPSYETDRAAFIGRGRSPVDPGRDAPRRARRQRGRGARPGRRDPQRASCSSPDETARVHLVTGVAETREGALALVEKYRDRHAGRPGLRAGVDAQPGGAAAARRHRGRDASSTGGSPATCSTPARRCARRAA